MIIVSTFKNINLENYTIFLHPTRYLWIESPDPT